MTVRELVSACGNDAGTCFVEVRDGIGELVANFSHSLTDSIKDKILDSKIKRFHIGQIGGSNEIVIDLAGPLDIDEA